MVIQPRGSGKILKPVRTLSRPDMNVPKNSIYGFSGLNSPGESTTIKLTRGPIKLTQGSAKVFGTDIRWESASIRKRVGYLARDPHYEDSTGEGVRRSRVSLQGPGPAG